MHPWLAFISFWKLLFGGKLPAAAAKFLPDGPKALPVTTEKVEKIVEKPVEKKANTAQLHRDGALAMLAMLQREGRLVDFLTEAIDGVEDAQLGAATREVHRGCKKLLDQYLVLESVMPGEEESKVSIPKGFDPAEVRLIGEAKGEPPYKGTLRHHGWRVTEAKLPSLAEGVDRNVLAPAEVEV